MLVFLTVLRCLVCCVLRKRKSLFLQHSHPRPCALTWVDLFNYCAHALAAARLAWALGPGERDRFLELLLLLALGAGRAGTGGARVANT